MHFRILKMIATSGFLVALECTKFVFGRGYAPGELTALPESPQLVQGSSSSNGKGQGKGKGRGAEEEVRIEKGRGDTPNANSCIRPY